MKNLNEMNLTEKKAIAYDIIVQIDNLRNQLQIVNQAIQEDLKNEKPSGTA
jgi:hypothetical protein